MIRKSVLSNGIPVISETMSHIRSVSVGVWLKKGSRHEPRRYNGVTHFIEHMVFKGTKKRSAQEIASLIDSIGGAVDAFTSKEYTCFYFRVLDEHLPVAVELVKDIVFNPLFDPADVKKERSVIEEEIKMSNDDPGDLVQQIFVETLYDHHPLRLPIAGTKRSIGKITPTILKEYFRRSYVPGNMLISLAGRLNHRKATDLLDAHFRELDGRRQKSPTKKPKFKLKTVVKRKSGLEQAHLLLGCEAIPVTHPLRFGVNILNTILGGNMSSRLFQKIREKEGLAYSVESFFQTLSDNGYFAVYAGVSPKNIKRALDLILKELREIVKNGVTKEELQSAKEYLKGNLMLSAEYSANRMMRLALGELLLRRREPLSRTIKQVNAVTREDVLKSAELLFGKERYAMAALGGKNCPRVKLL